MKSRAPECSCRRAQPKTLRPSRARRGTVLITAIWIIAVLTALALVFARSMQVEIVASGNHVAAEQAGAIEKGAEQYVLSVIEAAGADTQSALDAPAEAMQVGDGYFWILRPDPLDERLPAFGLIDEASKLNLNSASGDEILKLPGMTENIADAIVDWVDPDSDMTGLGAESDYYQSLRQPYLSKNGPLESLEELYLVRDVNEDLLYGYDRNHDGVLSNVEQATGGLAGAINSGNSTGRGIAPFVTVHSTEANVDSSGAARANVNDVDTSKVRNVLTNALQQSRADAILGQTRTARPFTSVLDFAVKGSMTSAELAQVGDRLTHTTNKTLPGLVNVNTAPREVLMCLPGLEESDADALIAARPNSPGSSTGTSGSSSLTSASSLSETSSTSSDISWVLEALKPDKASAVGSRITGRSYQYSADILATTGSGRAYKRVRIIVDARQTPAKIIYRKDLTALGWPLAEEIRTALAQGQSVAPMSTQGNGLSGTSH